MMHYNQYNPSGKASQIPREKINSTIHPIKNCGITKTSIWQNKKENIKVQKVKEEKWNDFAKHYQPENENSEKFLPKGYKQKQISTPSLPSFFKSISQPSPFEQLDYFSFPPAASNTDYLLKQLNEDEKIIKENFIKIPSMNGKETNFKDFSNKTYPIQYLNNGSFHTVFKSTSERNILFKFINSNLNLQTSHYDGKGDYRRMVLETGFNSYKQLQKEGFTVPKIFNNPLKDGYYVIEEIVNEPGLKYWNGNRSIKELDLNSQEQLQQVRQTLLKMHKKNDLLVPDFKPHNARFNERNELVIIDFCEDRTIPAFSHSLSFLLKEYAKEWADGNPKILSYLLDDIA
jgi:hypothetical protein